MIDEPGWEQGVDNAFRWANETAAARTPLLHDLAGIGDVADRLAGAADPGDPGQRALAEFARGIALQEARASR